MKRLILLSLCFLIQGCIGSFNTDETLSENYVFTASDSNIAVFYTIYPSVMQIAIKNVGSAFMTNLNISFECRMKDGTKTSMYSLGNLKPYFNKTLAIPIVYNDCLILKAEYNYFPESDGGFMNVGPSSNNMPQMPLSQFWGTIEIK